MVSQKRLAQLRSLDTQLLAELERRISLRTPGKRARERSFDAWQARAESADGVRLLSGILAKGGAFAMNIERHRVRDIDGDQFTMTIARAAVTDMWPMGTSYWVRDNALVAARCLASGAREGEALGKAMLLSALSFMSTVSQLRRFEAIARSPSAKFKNSPGNWPYIFASVKGNLNAATEEPWAHKQDAWQIVAWHVLEALTGGQISLRELNAKHRRFLGLIVPFLCSIDFVRFENSGSWEEIPAVRSSVRVWEHMLAVRLAELACQPEYGFISREFARQRRHLKAPFRKLSLHEAVERMDRDACAVMSRDLPFESPGYPKRDIRYREADGTLLYLLQLGYPQFLARRAGRPASWAAAVEAKILKQVLSLVDPKTGAICRYASDNYQRNGFFRHVTVARLTELYGGPSGDASGLFSKRDALIPKGRKASWTHLAWQLCAWAGERFLATGSPRYRALHDRFFRKGLGFVTGRREVSIDQGADGLSRIIPLPQLRMPECFIADQGPSGRELLFPSPHTPLNWAVAEMLNAFRVREEVLEQGASQPAARRRRAA